MIILGLNWTLHKFTCTVVVPEAKIQKCLDLIDILIGDIDKNIFAVKDIEIVMGNTNYINCSRRFKAGGEVAFAIYRWLGEGF